MSNWDRIRSTIGICLLFVVDNSSKWIFLCYIVLLIDIAHNLKFPTSIPLTQYPFEWLNIAAQLSADCLNKKKITRAEGKIFKNTKEKKWWQLHRKSSIQLGLLLPVEHKSFFECARETKLSNNRNSICSFTFLWVSLLS